MFIAEAGKQAQQALTSPLKAAGNVASHAQAVANNTPSKNVDSPSLGQDIKSGVVGGVKNMANQYASSTPTSAGGKLVSGALQMGRGVGRMAGAEAPSAPRPTQTPVKQSATTSEPIESAEEMQRQATEQREKEDKSNREVMEQHNKWMEEKNSTSPTIPSIDEEGMAYAYSKLVESESAKKKVIKKRK